MSPRRIAIICAGAAVLICGGAGTASIAFNRWKPSVLVHVSVTDRQSGVALHNDENFVLVSPTAHFDGVYFYTIALDPFGRSFEHRNVDRFAYRYGHPGYGWLAGLLAFGKSSRVPLALFLVGGIGAGLCGFGFSSIAFSLKRSGWWGMLAAFHPGIIQSVSMDTSEPIGLAFASLGMLAWIRNKRWWTMLWFALAALVKEVFIFVPAGLAAWEILAHLRKTGVHRFDRDLAERLLPLIVSGVPIVAWYSYLRLTFGTWPFQHTPRFYAAPLAGWYDSLRRGARYAISDVHAQIGAFAIPLIVLTAAALLLAAWFSLRVRTPFHAMYLLAFTAAVFFGWRLLLFPKDIVRELLLPTLLIPAVFIQRWPAREQDAIQSQERYTAVGAGETPG